MLTALIGGALWFKPEPAVAAELGGPMPSVVHADCEPADRVAPTKPRRGRPLGIGLGI